MPLGLVRLNEGCRIEEGRAALIDIIWKPYDKQSREKLEKKINLGKLDFPVVNQDEVNHSGALPYLMEKVPYLPIYCTAQCSQVPCRAVPPP
jgi:flavorubredoxin